MRKYFFIAVTVSALFVLSSCGKSSEPTTLAPLTTQVNSEPTDMSETQDFWLIESGNGVKYIYDEKGNLLGTTDTADTDDRRAIYNNYTYDSFGNPVGKIAEGDGFAERSYNDKGDITKQIIYDSTGTVLTETSYRYEYDTAGRISKTTVFFNGKEEYTDSFTYNDKGDLVTRLRHDSFGMNDLSAYEYDSDGDILSLTCTNNGTEYYREIYTYNTAGKLTEKKAVSIAGTVNRTAFTYDASGVLASSDEYTDDVLTATREYDKSGNVIKLISYTSSGSSTLIMTYDSHGNMLSKRYSFDDTPIAEYTYKMVTVSKNSIPALEKVKQAILG